MIWVGFTFDNKLTQGEMKVQQDSKDYQALLEDTLVPFLDSSQQKKYRFLQDKANIHNSKSTLNWFKLHNIELVSWTGYSPDMNPAVHVHALLVSHVYADGNIYYGIKELRKAIFAAWEKIIQNDIQKIISSLPNRVLELKEVKGGPTHY